MLPYSKRKSDKVDMDCIDVVVVADAAAVVFAYVVVFCLCC